MIGSLPPLAVAVWNCSHIERLLDTQGTIDLWSMDVKIGRYGFGSKTFNGVFVVELFYNNDQTESVCILGFQNADRNPSYIGDPQPNKSVLNNKELMNNQQKFIKYIEKEEKYAKKSLGLIGNIFAGNNYRVQAHILDEYTRARGKMKSDFIASYFSEEGVFEIERFNPLDIVGERDALTIEESREYYNSFDKWAKGEG